ncbi:zeta toxin family protein [Solirubrobacter ginsenosidimutans]|uniref:UDP-N-acetylglucosamine kinase n=1 Tax=Solirubrobacter ginsenosidimutans TaxID=490573 RepID=A0A9X3S4Y0_9ACTN|nr:zeta toxin family protein [Solirubrobacter ginsenosidimutans]MDA0167145.1 zeta toxin family protein [Solirubrobacter ginsenosidimutans]
MSSPVLYVLAGPNGSGKSTFAREVLQPVTHLPFINADEIAAQRWPGREEQHAYEASSAAAAARDEAFSRRESFITETVFSHRSKLDLVAQAVQAGYFVELHVMLVPEDLAVARVAYRVTDGGHTVPEDKVRQRYRRLWELIAQARQIAHRSRFYDNSRSSAFSPVAIYELGRPVGTSAWPAWTPAALTTGP